MYDIHEVVKQYKKHNNGNNDCKLENYITIIRSYYNIISKITDVILKFNLEDFIYIDLFKIILT